MRTAISKARTVAALGAAGLLTTAGLIAAPAAMAAGSDAGLAGLCRSAGGSFDQPAIAYYTCDGVSGEPSTGWAELCTHGMPRDYGPWVSELIGGPGGTTWGCHSIRGG